MIHCWQACIIGHKRNHSEEDQCLINDKITEFINKRCDTSKKAQQKGEKDAARKFTSEICDISCADCDKERQKLLKADTDSNASEKSLSCENCKQLRKEAANQKSGVNAQGAWISTFQTRNESKVPRNCSLIDKGVKDHCINTVTDKLLSTVNMKPLEDGRIWNKGGAVLFQYNIIQITEHLECPMFLEARGAWASSGYMHSGIGKEYFNQSG